MRNVAQHCTMGTLSATALVAVMVTGCQPTDRRPEPPKPPQVAETYVHMGECATETSPGPCTWHADLHGNSEGLSFDVTSKGVRYWGPADYRRYDLYPCQAVMGLPAYDYNEQGATVTVPDGVSLVTDVGGSHIACQALLKEFGSRH